MTPHEQIPAKRPKLGHRFDPILSDDTLNPVEPIELCTYNIQDKRNVPKLLKILPELPPFLSHIKRIKDGKIIVHDKSEIPHQELIDEIRRVEGREPQFVKIQAPKAKPKTRKQFELAKQLWPTGFHEDKRLESLLDGSFFSDLEKEKMARLFSRAQEIGGCVIHDPKNDVTITETPGNPDIPNGHPIICAVNYICEEARKNDPLKKSDQYLAMDYDVYVNSEPCAMCAMSLVHMRIGRVFFGRTNPVSGALSSHFRLHLKPEINHHYEVFRIIVDGS